MSPGLAATAATEAPDIWDPGPDVEAEPDMVGTPPPDIPWTHAADAAPSAAGLRAAPGSAGDRGLGDTGAYTFHELSLDGDEGAQVIKVNIGSGNLFVRAKMGELRSPGVPAVAYRIYNSSDDSTAGHLGPWREDYAVTGLEVADDLSAVTYSDGTGARWTFTAEAGTWTTPSGMNADLSQDADGTWLVTYHRTGEVLHFNTHGWVTNRVDRNGVGISYGYDGDRVVSVKNAAGRSLRMDYYPEDALESVDSAGRSVSFGRDDSDRLVLSDETGMGRPAWAMTYDASDRLATLAGDGRALALEYDDLGRVLTATLSGDDAESLVTTFEYMPEGTTVTDPRGGQTRYEVDDRWRVTQTTDQTGRVTTQTWTENSDVESTTEGPGEDVTSSTYDELNNHTGITLPTGATTQSLYAQGPECDDAQEGHPYQVKCTVDASGSTMSMRYDDAGNLVSRTDSSAGGTGSTHTYVYQAAGGAQCGGEPGQVCSSVDALAQVTAYEYVRGNLTSVTPPGPLGTTTYEYDLVGRVTQVTDGNGDTTRYAYDKADRITQTTFADGETLTNVWSPGGRLLSEHDTGVQASTLYEYDLLGNQVSKSWDSSRVMHATLTSRTDANGNVTSTRGGATAFYTYDAADRLTAVSGGTACATIPVPALRTDCVHLTYDDTGHEASRIFPGGARQDTTYDASGRAVRMTATDVSGTVVWDVSLSYTSDGTDQTLLQTRTSHVEDGIPRGAVTRYGYDSMGRLVLAEETASGEVTARWAYEYDAVGNRTSQTREGSTGADAGTITYEYDAAHQIVATSADTAAWEYDAVGNQLRNGITGEVSTYGDRLEVRSHGETEYTTFGQGNDQQLTAGYLVFFETVVGRSAALTTEVDGYGQSWVRHPGGDAIYQVAETFVAPTSSFYVTDHLGSVVGHFGSTGTLVRSESYSPFGEGRSGRSPLDGYAMRFAGGYEEKPNLFKLGARYYDASLGRFTQPDPSGQESNPYVYAANNPTTRVDPSGLDSCSAAAGVAGVVHSTIWGGALLSTGAAGLVVGAAVSTFWFGVSELGCD